jgi:hypothetical protein
LLPSGRSGPAACSAPVACVLVACGGRFDAVAVAAAVVVVVHADAWLHFGGGIAGDGGNLGCDLELGVGVGLVEVVAAAAFVGEVEVGARVVMVADDGVGLVGSAEIGKADVPGSKDLAGWEELVVSTVEVEAVVVGVVGVERAR